MYGEKYDEFYEKFVIRPLSKDKNRQVVGAVWSTHAGDLLGKGFGKSMLMAEESMRINHDLGASKLREYDIDEDDIERHPFVAGYCSFDQAKEVKSFSAALLDAVGFILESKCGDRNVHQELRDRVLARIEADPDFTRTSICQALMKEIHRYRGLNIHLFHKALNIFIDRLSGSDTEELVNFVRHEIGPRVKSAQGFNFVHVFNIFLSLAGVEYVVYFIDQIENFAKFVRNQERDLKILRESMCQTSPTAEMASFIFQMHIQAQQVIEDWWDNTEHLPSLDVAKPINATRIVDLKGLTKAKQAETLAALYLKEKRPNGTVGTVSQLHPFNSEIIEAVRQSVSGNPRKFLEQLGAILDHGEAQKIKKLDLSFVIPLIENDATAISMETDDDEEYSNPER